MAEGPSVLTEELPSGVLVITLNRPERRNALDLAAAEALADALDLLDEQVRLRVGVLIGAGRTFCAGMDLKTFRETGERPVTERRGAFGIVARPSAKPLIAAVDGAVLGGGFEIALACDLVVAARLASFGLPEVRRGLVAAAGGAIRLPQRIPHALAMEVLLTGQPLSAPRAAELGLVNRVCESEALLDSALALAGEVAKGAPLALAATKRIAVESPSWEPDERFVRQEEVLAPVRSSKDALEGPRAFAEKREPVWVGR